VKKLHDFIHEISVDKKMTSLHVNSKISVDDKRMSSAMIGYVGALCLSLPLLLMIAVDIMNCFTRKGNISLHRTILAYIRKFKHFCGIFYFPRIHLVKAA
jgi:hypothetical protein